jgi:hypothetical protein
VRGRLAFWKRRSGPEAAPEQPDPRAEALREKLAEARSIVEERDEFEGAETPVDRAEPSADTPERRRQNVHETGRDVASRMRDET